MSGSYNQKRFYLLCVVDMAIVKRLQFPGLSFEEITQLTDRLYEVRLEQQRILIVETNE